MGAKEMLTAFFIFLIYVVSAQYDNQPMTFQPIPVMLQLPNGEQQIPENLRYSVTQEGAVEDNRSKNPVVGMYLYNTPYRRNDISREVPNTPVRFQEEKTRSNYRNRYENSYGTRQPGRMSRGWNAMYSDHPPRRSSSSRKTQKVHPRYFPEESMVAEIRRTPRVIKYIADKNGFAVREDLYKPLQGTLNRSRQQRILTAAGSAPQMSQVVTSAIKVTNGQSESSGKYVPQIVDLKVG